MLRITVPVTIELTGELAPDEHGLIPGSENWVDGPWEAHRFALDHLSIELHLPAEWMRAHVTLTVGKP